MAQQHDMLDDIIDISKGFGSFKNPLTAMTDTLTGAAPEAPVWNPADYKERPRANTLYCTVCQSEKSTCTACMDVCPVNAIDIDTDEASIDIADSCRKCGLCAAVCPTEAYNSPMIGPRHLYDKIAEAATAHTTAYVTCTRALRRMPRDNEVVLACVGDVTAEVWFSLLCSFKNISVFLPLDVCTKCRTVTGEETLGEAIATAEEWSGRSMGLAVERRELVCTKRRAYERKEFMSSIAKNTGLTVAKLNPATAAVTSVAEKMRAHANRISDLERALDRACGVTSQKDRRVLKEGRQLLLSTLQAHPKRASRVRVQRPDCDPERCTMCGACVEACPVHACDLNGSGRWSVEPTYCLGCGLCAEVCGDHALTMVERDGAELVVPDPEAERKAKLAAEAKAEYAEAKAQVKKTVDKVLDSVEKFAE